jgi:hypothetical protein
MMRMSALGFGLLAMLVFSFGAKAVEITYNAILNGASEVPPVETRGTGTAAVDVDAATKGISWRVAFGGLSSPVVGADIRCAGAVGARGAGIAVTLGRAPHLANPLVGAGRLTDAQFADLQAGGCYVDIQTKRHLAGELRGRLQR